MDRQKGDERERERKKLSDRHRERFRKREREREREGHMYISFAPKNNQKMKKIEIEKKTYKIFDKDFVCYSRQLNSLMK